MAKPELGAKRQCQSCGAKFFDLNKDPIVCPKCGTIFQGVVARAERASAKEDETEDESCRPRGRRARLARRGRGGRGEGRRSRGRRHRRRGRRYGADDAFLEEEEEDDDDVSALIDGEIAPDEEP